MKYKGPARSGWFTLSASPSIVCSRLAHYTLVVVFPAGAMVNHPLQKSNPCMACACCCCKLVHKFVSSYACARCATSQVWEKYGVKGIEKLRGKMKLGDKDGGFQRMMSLSRGADHLGFDLDFAAAGAVSSIAAAAAQQQKQCRVSAATQLPPWHSTWPGSCREMVWSAELVAAGASRPAAQCTSANSACRCKRCGP
jgi:hypothetical protein